MQHADSVVRCIFGSRTSMTYAKSTLATANLGVCGFTRGGDTISYGAADIERAQAHLIVCIYAKDVAGIKAAFSELHAGKLIESLKQPRYFPVHAAIMSDDRAVLRALVEALPAVVLDVPDESNRTPLMCAAELGRTADVQILLAGNASADVTDDSGYSALTWAALSGHAEVVKVLLEYEEYADSGGNAQAGIDRQDKQGNTPLMLAIRLGHYDVVAALIERSANVNLANFSREHALSLSVLLGRHRIVSLLCDHGALDLNAMDKKGVTALMYAADYAAQTYDSSILNLLIKCNAKTDVVDSDGCTALLRAAKGGSDIAIEHLILGGAAVDVVDSSGCCAVALAAKHNNFYALKYLLRQPNVVVDRQDYGGRTPLYHAVAGGYRDAAYELIKYGANINRWHVASATTVLTVAKRRGDQAMVGILVTHGASDQMELRESTACIT